MKVTLYSILLGILCQMGALRAATFTVTNSNDSGNGSLRKAIQDANLTAGADTINFDTAGHFSVARTITLTSGELQISKTLTIDAPAGANVVTVSGNNASRVFNVLGTSDSVTMRHLTMRFGSAVGGNGGALTAVGTTVTLEDCTLRNNGTNTVKGGAIWAEVGTLVLTDCVVAQNHADEGGGIGVSSILATITGGNIGENDADVGDGGGIYGYYSTITIQGTTVATNQGRYGAALYLFSASATLRDCTVSGNESSGLGGGIYAYSGTSDTVAVTNCTFSGNLAVRGGALYANGNGMSASLVNCTLTLNTSERGGGIYRQDGDVTLANCIVAGNTATSNVSEADLFGTITSHGHNLIGIDPSGADDFVNGNDGDLEGTSGVPLAPLLGPLQNNGGATLTHALLYGSPAIDAGNSAQVTDPPFFGPTFYDQRRTGFPRIQGNSVDIGAVEFPVLEVTNTLDSGAGSLRDVVAQANLGGGVITFKRNVFNSSRQTIAITSGVISISANITILAPDVGVRIDGQNAWRIFNVSAGQVTLDGLELYRGQHALGGGAVVVFGTGTTLTMLGCRVTDSQADDTGGGILVGASTTLYASDCAFLDNRSNNNGGGGLFVNGTATLTNCTAAGNRAALSGGGISGFGAVTLINCTVVENIADSDANGSGDGGGIRRGSGTVSLGNTIVANNVDSSPSGTVHPDISSSFTTLGHNLIAKSDGGTGLVNGVNGDKVGTIASPVDPLLSARVDDAFHVPSGVGPAKNAGDNALLAHSAWLETPERDQRGQFRTVDGTVEIGAVEWPSLTVVKLTIQDGEASEYGLSPAKFRLRRSFTSGSFVATFNIDASSTASGLDYTFSGPSFTSSPLSVTFPDGDSSILVTVTPTQDTTAEGTETVAISLTGSGYALDSAATNTQSINILDNEFLVTNSSSNGSGSLRQAVEDANASGGGKITIPSALNIALGGTALVINSDTEITGNASTISAAGQSRVFDITGDGGGCVKLQGLFITGGSTLGIENGGGIRADDACVEIRGCSIFGNRAGGHGGGVFIGYNNTDLTVLNTAIISNHAGFGGGGLSSFADTCLLTNVTVGRNTADFDGGGVDASGTTSTIILTNCTITENTADAENDGSGEGGGLFWPSSTVTFNNTVISGNFDTPNNAGIGSVFPNVATISGLAATGGGNFIGNRLGAASLFPAGSPNANNDYVGTPSAPLSAGLAYQADLKPFYIFPPSSLLQNHGINALNSEPNDQRGRTRIGGGTIDIGAVEMTSFMVTNTNGGNTLGSLRRAVNDANGAGGGDILFDEITTFQTHQIISLNSTGQLSLTTPISIFGPAARVTVNGTVGRVMQLAPVAAASFYVSKLILANGNADTTYAAGSRVGGGLLVSANASASLENVVVRDCLATETGGGILVDTGGSLEARDCSVYQCSTSGLGAGIASRGTLLVERAAIYNNNATVSDGGGFYNMGTATLVNATFYNNFAQDEGGGVYSTTTVGQGLELRSCSIVDNQAANRGGGIFRNGLSGIATIKNCQLNGNSADSGNGPDLFGAVLTLGHNLVTRNTSVAILYPAGSPNANADFVGTGAAPLNAPLGPFKSNGGLTWTSALACGNPGMDNGSNEGAAATDQRGLARLYGSALDIGAYELQPESYTYWASYAFPTAGAPLTGEFDDFDNDGAKNSLEYLAGTDPGNANSRLNAFNPPVPVTWNGSLFSVSYNISPIADPASYRVRMSTDMQSWALAPSSITIEGCAGLTNQIRFSRSFPGTTKRAFARLEYVPTN